MAPRNPLLDLPFMGHELERVEATLRGSVESPDAFLTEIASHLIVAGGKRVRPVLAVAAAAAGGRAVTDAVIQGGVSVELVHIGSLYHDDVMDEAELRRQVASVNARWGNLKAIIAGDFLLARASEIAASLSLEVAALLAATIRRLCEGQLLELRHTYDMTRSESDYFASIEGKTASLFAAACRIGGLVSDLDRPHVEAVTTYGLELGLVFQIVDDLLDLTATEAQLGKPAGHDLDEGVYTLPVIATLAGGDAAADELRDLLGRPLESAEREKALGIVRSNGGIPYALAAARRHADAARAAALLLPPSDTRDALAIGGHAMVDGLNLG